jgi:hypothetical protein
MKKEYSKTNCFTPQDLTDSMHHDKVKLIAVDPNTTFHDWDKLENEYLKVLTVVNSKHIFTVDINRNNGNSMWLQDSRDVIETEQVLVLPLYHNNSSAFWKELQPQGIPPVGIQDIKLQELYKKRGGSYQQRRSNSGDITMKLHPKQSSKKSPSNPKRPGRKGPNNLALFTTTRKCQPRTPKRTRLMMNNNREVLSSE